MVIPSYRARLIAFEYPKKIIPVLSTRSAHRITFCNLPSN